MSKTLELNGLSFRVEHKHDESTDAPWDMADGHGPVSDWRLLDTKRAGERVLCKDRGQRARFYDYEEAMKIAKRDGWGLSDEEKAKLASKLGREPTKGEIAARAVEKDFEFLRAWCNDEWHYIGVVVTLLDIDGDPIEEQSASLWGIESNAGAYLDEVAKELAEEIAGRVGDGKEYVHTVSARTTTYAIRN